jgi:primosomal protein N' (replication factor Y)
MSAIWVRPDVPGFARVFSYVLPESMSVPVGTIVRVPLQGRRVRGWVVPEQGPVPQGPLREVLAVVSVGPPACVLELADWTAWRYGGNPVSLLRVASPPNRVRERVVEVSGSGPGHSVRVVAVPPMSDRMALIRSAIASTGSTIIILPPGSRARRLVDALRAAGHEAVALLGNQSDADRTAAWHRARAGGCVVVGGRIAAFAPVPDLAGMVVLDEGDEALTEERAPTWNARTVAVERSRRAAVPLLLVSPAPSLEARVLVSAVERPARDVERHGWPPVEVVDRRDEEHRVGILTVPFAAAAHRALDRGMSVVAVVNRKGRVRLFACGRCHALARCEACAAALEERDEALGCPRCGATRPRVCAECFGTKLKVVRSGVTRLADDLRALLPRATVADVDAASGSVDPADVYIGTEAVLHRAPRGRPIGLVAFLDFDQELLAARIRAAEQAQWLMIRAARLLGAPKSGGRLLLQTTLPDHPVVVAARTADPELVAEAERPIRTALGFPPFGGLAAVRGDLAAVEALIKRADEQGVTVVGPTASATGLTALIRAATSEELAAFLAASAGDARALGRIRIDVDPLRA